MNLKRKIFDIYLNHNTRAPNRDLKLGAVTKFTLRSLESAFITLKFSGWHHLQQSYIATLCSFLLPWHFCKAPGKCTISQFLSQHELQSSHRIHWVSIKWSRHFNSNLILAKRYQVYWQAYNGSFTHLLIENKYIT